MALKYMAFLVVMVMSCISISFSVYAACAGAACLRVVAADVGGIGIKAALVGAFLSRADNHQRNHFLSLIAEVSWPAFVASELVRVLAGVLKPRILAGIRRVCMRIRHNSTRVNRVFFSRSGRRRDVEVGTWYRHYSLNMRHQHLPRILKCIKSSKA